MYVLLDRDFRRVESVTPTQVHDAGVDRKDPNAALPVRQNARRGVATASRGREPQISPREVWLDCDVAKFLKVSVRTVKRIANDGPRPGEIDLRQAKPVCVGWRRWWADNVRALVRDGVVG